MNLCKNCGSRKKQYASGERVCLKCAAERQRLKYGYKEKVPKVRRTHCRLGHPYTSLNKLGDQVCGTCDAKRKAKYKMRYDNQVLELARKAQKNEWTDLGL